MKRREITVKSILTRTGIEGFDYCINPYIGCEHGCTYCYASFMKRFTGHHEPWGMFLDAKMNGPDLLEKQLKNKREGSVLVGTVTDPYQPAEEQYRITRGCMEALKDSPLEVNILTRSPLCLRDMDIFEGFGHIEVGVSVSTDREEMRALFEPSAPSIESRVMALKTLHAKGVRTYAFIGPILPLNPSALVELLVGAVDKALIDRLNYSHKVSALYRREGLTRFLHGDYYREAARMMRAGFEEAGVPVSVLFGCDDGVGGPVNRANPMGGYL
jgi:DNA repair photolyase